MPLHDVGYRGWEGVKTSLLGRWWIVAKTGVSLAFRSTWLSRTLILSTVPAVVFGVAFFFFENSVSNVGYRPFFQAVVQSTGIAPELAQTVGSDPDAARGIVWSTLLLLFFRNPQSIAMLIVVGMVAPRLIAMDLRNRGYLLYFSRPLQPLGYILGKALVICTFLALITTLPALLLYGIGLCLSPDISVFFDTWDLPLRILAASLVLMIPVSAVALACSSMTVETRYATFAWFAIWVVGWLSYSLLRFGETVGRGGPGRRRFREGPPRFEEGGPRFEEVGPRFEEGAPRFEEGPRFDENSLLAQSDWEVLSPFHVLGRMQQYVFGLYPEDQSIIPYAAVLIGVTLFCVWFIRRQILARLKA